MISIASRALATNCSVRFLAIPFPRESLTFLEFSRSKRSLINSPDSPLWPFIVPSTSLLSYLFKSSPFLSYGLLASRVYRQSSTPILTAISNCLVLVSVVSLRISLKKFWRSRVMKVPFSITSGSGCPNKNVVLPPSLGPARIRDWFRPDVIYPKKELLHWP